MSRRYTAEELRTAARDAALHEWERVTRDDDGGKIGDRDRITHYYETIGRANLLPVDPTTGARKYREIKGLYWCSVGAMFAYMQIGDFVEPDRCVPVYIDVDIPFRMLSTWRLAQSENWEAAGTPEPDVIDAVSSPGRALDALAIPGTLATIVTRPHYGNYRDTLGGHVVLSNFVEGDKVHTIEFNGRGTLGDGTKGEGVVKNVHDISVFRKVYPLDDRHFEQFSPDVG